MGRRFYLLRVFGSAPEESNQILIDLGGYERKRENLNHNEGRQKYTHETKSECDGRFALRTFDVSLKRLFVLQ
jgi:hypothetical protein